MNRSFLTQGKMIRCTLLFTGLTVLFVCWGLGLAWSATEGGQASQSPWAHLASQKGVDVSVENDKTWISIPVPEKVMVSPEYDHPELVLNFTPGIQSQAVRGMAQSKLVDGVAFDAGANGLASDVTITVSQPVQFLLSRPAQDRLRVLLVASNQAGSSTMSGMTDASWTNLSGIEFTQDREGFFYIKLRGNGGLEYVTQNAPDDQIRLLLPRVEVPEDYTKLYRLDKFNTVVKTALLKNTNQGAQLNLSVGSRVPFNVEYGAQSLILVFDGSQAMQAEARDSGNDPRTEQAGVAELDELNALFPGMKQNYTGQRISIDLQDAEVEHVLRLIAEVSGYNLIIDDAVSGKISLKLEDVPWDQALDLVLLQKGLGMVIRGNIMRIATSQQLNQENARLQEARRQALEAKESLQALEPLHTEYIQVNYTTANALQPQVQPFLSERGSVSNDSRTNLLIVSDTRMHIDNVRRVVQKLDRPERQVLIEARIVTASDEFQKGLGLRWGGGFEQTKQDGQIVQGIHGLQGATSTGASNVNLSGFAVNLPNQGPSTFGIGGFISKLTGQDLFTLDAELQLGEEKNLTRIISSPRIVTLNNQRAEIQQGTLVASQAESESGGTTTEYTEAVLKLSVQPQITPDNKLILDLEISDDAPAPTGDDISTRKATTKLIVNNEETIVLGGVHRATERDNEDKVPGLGDIPLLGWAFKNQFDSRNQEELLVFIRPKILD